MEIFFATSNKDKFKEALHFLKDKVTVKHLPFDYVELRSENIEEIARDAALAAYKRCREPVFVEDSALIIDALKGFPGTYSSWAFRKIGNEGILKLMEGVRDRKATFETRIAFVRRKEEVHIFRGSCEGTIAIEARGTEGFGYDPIFIPAGEHQTFAESIELKNKLSHRYKALLEFYKSQSLRL
ncbi:RdgB/HAM1 family non-canonical purine NTP pyrophosphatase [Candidatus Micrarchaeota archaeon]|nr:RdgB/HAM1 family non-canonical purine NTP pyrophosphatase [Candidatus Micrarchaeota archaeon]